MTLQETLAALESMGTEQNRKVYGRHGAGPRCYGVSFANLGALKKKIKTDHALARELWATGNADARLLATMIADPKTATVRELDGWLKDIQYYVLVDLFSKLVAESPLAPELMDKWIGSSHDSTGQAGYNLLGYAAMKNAELPDSFFEEHLAVIEKTIHTRKNRTRHAMNGALIAIGLRSERLRALAIAAARRIGKVEVDHGETNCETPDAASYIERTVAMKARVSKKKR